MKLRDLLHYVIWAQHVVITVRIERNNNKVVYNGRLSNMINDKYQDYFVFEMYVNKEGYLVIFISSDEI